MSICNDDSNRFQLNKNFIVPAISKYIWGYTLIKKLEKFSNTNPFGIKISVEKYRSEII